MAADNVKANKYIIHLIGDAHKDCFYENGELVASCYGGVSFVEKIINSKIEPGNSGIKTINHTKICDKKRCKDDKNIIGPIFEAHRKVIYDNGKARYLDKLSTDFKLSDSEKVYTLDMESFFSIEKDKGNFFVIEHIGDHDDSACGAKYTSILNNEILFKSIINNLYNSIIDNHEDCGNAIKKIPQFFWIIHRKLPIFLDKRNKAFTIFNDDNSSGDDPFLGQEPSLRQKIEKIKSRSVIFLIANTLRQEGVNISRYISWERSAQDYIKAFYSNKIMEEIKGFSHVIVRFGLSGAIYSAGTFEDVYKTSTTRGPERIIHRIFFDPLAPKNGIYRDPDNEGDVIGYQSLFLACSILSLLEYKSNFTSDIDFIQVIGAIGLGIKKAIRSCQIIFDNGFNPALNSNKIEAFFKDVEKSIGQVLSKNRENKKYLASSIADERIPIDIPGWSILKQSAEYRLAEIAEAVVYKEVKNVLNTPCEELSAFGINRIIWSPIVEFGSLIVVDRREIEGYKSVHALMQKTIKGKRGRPLSIAVFGPPGSGKSFAIKELIASAMPLKAKKDDLKKFIQYETINMTEISSFDSFEQRINDIKETYNNKFSALESKRQRKILVIFFDEFDCSFNGEELGWIKRFLPIMEDWNYAEYENKHPSKRGEEYDQEDEEQKGSAIFVFAGGTSHNYSDFSREDGTITEEQKASFIIKKGPDFVSRLRGHINILGPNRVDDNDDGHVIRRAIFLRAILDGLDNDEDNEQKIDKAVLKAMLRVSTFKHGVRSMRAIITMCSTLGGNSGKIVGSTLPTLPQLNMHVNGKEFMEMITEYGMQS